MRLISSCIRWERNPQGCRTLRLECFGYDVCVCISYTHTSLFPLEVYLHSQESGGDAGDGNAQMLLLARDQ